ncbi:MAG TPA: class I SAM-dependent methyltransferase [Sporichthyaceae bacterium]|nr:class I SAM-dependent methyltransferase [Sporichthyaceae bacterium]
MSELRTQLRAWYAEQLATGVERFLEEPRRTCPWCGSPDLAVRIRTPELIQGKPGMFRLSRCRTCRHLFQNPRLNLDGLSFYYRDFYDGLGASVMEPVFDGATAVNTARARDVLSVTQPGTWLDVGTGYGYFAKHARAVLPDTVFEGLDLGEGVELGERRGWLARGHRGLFGDLVEELSGRFDVVSMHHYLEHTRDPRAELDAAARVLRPGNHLLVEMPDPDYGLAPAFGRWWFPLLQPQHQHMIPLPNLLGALRERGFEILRITRGPAHIGIDATWALVQLFAVVARDPSLPWLTEPETPARRRRHELVWKRVAPKAFQAMHHVDAALTKLAKATDDANTYRVLARRSA